MIEEFREKTALILKANFPYFLTPFLIAQERRKLPRIKGDFLDEKT